MFFINFFIESAIYIYVLVFIGRGIARLFAKKEN